MTTSNSKVESRLNGDEWGLQRESTVGIPRDGYADPTGEYPHRENWFNSSVSSAARGVIINDLWMGGSAMGVSFDVPSATSSIFPFNQSNTTPSGHSFEIDDTPGNERILIKHHTGAGVELKQDGSVAIASRSHQVQVVGADHELVVSGQGNLTYNGDLNLTVNGDYNVDVGGTYNLRVGSNFYHTVSGSHLTEVGDIHSTLVRGNKDVRVFGDTFNFHSSELKVVSKKDIRMIASKDFIVNSGRSNRMTAEDTFTTSAGKNTVISGKDVVVTGSTGKIGGESFHYTGLLYTGPDDDNGTKTVFQGNLVGKALEAWTSNFAQFSAQAHRSLLATEAERAIYATYAGRAKGADVSNLSVAADNGNGGTGAGLTMNTTNETAYPDGFEGIDAWIPDSNTSNSTGSQYKNFATPEYNMDWDWAVELDGTSGETSHTLAKARVGTEVNGNYSTNTDWWELFNKVSPYAVRKVIVDPDGMLENKISKLDEYSYYFKYTPTTSEIRSKLRTMDGGADLVSAPDGHLDSKKCIESLVFENRLHPDWSVGAPSNGYSIVDNSGSSPTPKFGRTPLGNPVDRMSKLLQPAGRSGVSKTVVADAIYNPDTQSVPITSSTKLSRSSTVAKFLGAPGSRSSLDSIPILEDRQNLARQWYLQADFMEGVAAAKDFSNYKLQVTEGYYNPSQGIREHWNPSVALISKYWIEPFERSNGGGGTQMSSVSPSSTINELKHNGRAVVYTLYNSNGKVDYAATYDLSLYIRDNLLYDQMSLDYDMTRPDGVMGQQIIVIMPKVDPSFNVTFSMKISTYFNRQVLSGSELLHIE